MINIITTNAKIFVVIKLLYKMMYHKECEIIQKFNEKAQMANFSDLTRQRQELCAGNAKKHKN